MKLPRPSQEFKQDVWKVAKYLSIAWGILVTFYGIGYVLDHNPSVPAWGANNTRIHETDYDGGGSFRYLGYGVMATGAFIVVVGGGILILGILAIFLWALFVPAESPAGDSERES